MVSVTAGQSPKVAASYFKEHLTRDDYYSEAERIRGEWVGAAAERLGLRGEIKQEDFVAVISNDLDRFGQKSRPRRSRNCHYDFTFTAPKSVSILSMRDDRVRALHLAAVKKAFSHIESLARVRDRRGDLYRSETVRATGNLVAGLFVHESSRANDPNLHVHTVIANLSFDGERQQWLALQAAEIYRQRKLLDKIALAELAHGLRGLGYELERTEHAFEVQGIGRDLIERFSQRRAQVEQLTEELRADPTRLTLLYAKYKVKTRFDLLPPAGKAAVKRTVAGLTDAEVRELATLATRPEKEAKTRRELLALMDRRISPVQSRKLDDVVATAAASRKLASRDDHSQAVGETTTPCAPFPPLAPEQALRFALDHELERASAVSEARILETLLHHATGRVRFDEARATLDQDGGPALRLISPGGEHFVTTSAVLAEEKAAVDFVRRTRGTCRQLDPGQTYRPANSLLSAEQLAAVDHIRFSRDRVLAIRGIAGTGKTTLLQESVRALHAAGHSVCLFAPSSEASRGVLRQEAAAVVGETSTDEALRAAFREAETVEKLLVDPALQARAAGAVLWIDEAGLLSTPALGRVFSLADRLGCRVVLAGDTGQHSAVERGDALRILERHAGLVPAELTTIRRQRRAEYRRVVEAFAQGNVEKGCRRLGKLGAWREVADDAARYDELGRDFVELTRQGKEVLAVSPTHAESAQVTAAIRARLRGAGLLGNEERTFQRLANTHLTQAQKAEAASYQPGQVLQFVRPTPAFASGERVTVRERLGPDRLLIERADGRREPFALLAPRSFGVYTPAQVAVSPGDRLRVTQNGTVANRVPGSTTDALRPGRAHNGTLLSVKGFTLDGNIECVGGVILPRDYAHLASGYCLTSHASQGKTVDYLLLAENGRSAQSAGSRKQGYVSLSRGREGVRIYTDDRQAVEAAWRHDGERLAALDLLPAASQRQQGRSLRRRRSVRAILRETAFHVSRRLRGLLPAIGTSHRNLTAASSPSSPVLSVR